MSGSIIEVFNDFIDSKVVARSYKDRNGKHVCVTVEKPLLKVARDFCEKKGIAINELFRIVDSNRPEELSRSKALNVVLMKIYFNKGDLDINA